MNALKNTMYAFFAVTIAMSFGFYLSDREPQDRAGRDIPPAARSVSQLASVEQPSTEDHFASALKADLQPLTAAPANPQNSASTADLAGSPTTENTQTQWSSDHEYDVRPIEEPEWATRIEEEPEVDMPQSADENRFQALEEKLRNETRDDEWADRIEQNFNQIFAEAILEDSVIIDMHCRTSLCKFEVLHSTNEAANIFVTTFVNRPDLSLTSQNVFMRESKDPSGVLTADYYWSK